MMRLNPKLGCFLFLNLVGVATMLTLIIQQYSRISNTLTELDQAKNTDIVRQDCFKVCGHDYSQQAGQGLCCISLLEESTCKIKAHCLADYIQVKEEKLDELSQKLDYYYALEAMFIAVSLFFICRICTKRRPSLRRQQQLQRRAVIARLILHLNIWSRTIQSGRSAIRRSLLTESYISEDKSETCAVCLDCFNQEEVTRLDCGHIFHFKCVEEWIQYNNCCPICRARQ